MAKANVSLKKERCRECSKIVYDNGSALYTRLKNLEIVFTIFKALIPLGVICSTLKIRKIICFALDDK
ncbi:hypothetical protein EUGRSUZ_B03779 [Eucalyptus grandis]|uniref:Uncharacterized protein n=2 Tax=Eucalyptus grandis TaxID=71139 RepID=A0ACC3LXM5_EUCGR|nr:hypothetical protein EUGRSUZ_B03779 [Eucalyptus grandis]